MIRIIGFDVLLTAMEDGLVSEKFGENAANGPDVCNATEHRNDLSQNVFLSDQASQESYKFYQIGD